MLKSFVSPSFFRLFDMLMSTTNPGFKRARWSFEGVDCEHERHSFTGRAHGFAVETTTLTRGGRRAWSLLVVKEFWWTGEASDAARITRWARPTAGNRGDILGWLRTQELALARTEIGRRSGIAGELAEAGIEEDG
jgi:hypothetical protein